MEFDPLDKGEARLEQPLFTEAEAAALARATVNLFAHWRISDAEARIILGGISEKSWDLLKGGGTSATEQDTQMRMSILMGIHAGLRYLFVDTSRGYDWVKKPNTNFDGLSALDIMKRGDLADLLAVREYLNAERGV
ncbi:MbcA/ParS/Xre antitoxin family protein [Thalassospira lucentensis]|uniref:MbcA/ParS/Xre antitoxin family protein n=1 Tax=Thalassospira lucentensis TaxID=168935 RepID=UPI003D2E8DA5